MDPGKPRRTRTPLFTSGPSLGMGLGSSGLPMDYGRIKITNPEESSVKPVSERAREKAPAVQVQSSVEPVYEEGPLTDTKPTDDPNKPETTVAPHDSASQVDKKERTATWARQQQSATSDLSKLLRSSVTSEELWEYLAYKESSEWQVQELSEEEIAANTYTPQTCQKTSTVRLNPDMNEQHRKCRAIAMHAYNR